MRFACLPLMACAACGAVEAGPGSGADDAAAGDDAPEVDASTTPADAAPPLGGCDVAPTVPGGFTRLTGNLAVDYGGNGVHAVDVTHFANIWHYWSTSPDPVPWPGAYGTIAMMPVPTTRYVSAELTVPQGYVAHGPDNLYGEYDIGETGATALISMTISTHCGDFGQLSPSTVVPGCVLNGAGPDYFLAWTKSQSCVLADGQTYYLNIINADISALAGGGSATSTANDRCSGGACTDPIANGPGTWGSYTPP
jgi:hypothetical protein